MGTKRTPWGKVAFAVLTAAFIVTIVECILEMLELGVNATGVYSASILPIMLFMMLLIFAVIGFVNFAYWNAYRKNEPQRIYAVTTAIFVCFVIFFIFYLLSLNTLRDPMISAYLGYMANPDIAQAIFDVLGIIVVAIVLFAETTFHKKGKMPKVFKYMWVVVLFFEAYSFYKLLVGGYYYHITFFQILKLVSGFLSRASIVFISCWIANQGKFYFEETAEVPAEIGETEQNDQTIYPEQ